MREFLKTATVLFSFSGSIICGLLFIKLMSIDFNLTLT